MFLQDQWAYLQRSRLCNNFILPYPDLLLLGFIGKMIDASANIDDQNNGEGKECGFSHDASGGDFDNDGDIDIFACNILLQMMAQQILLFMKHLVETYNFLMVTQQQPYG